MREEEARATMEDRVARGGRIMSVMTAQLPAMKAMQDRLLEAGIPAMLGPGRGGG